MDIEPKVSELSFENDTISNTLPTPFRYIGNDIDKTTKRYTLANRSVDTRYNTSTILRTRYHVSMEFTEG